MSKYSSDKEMKKLFEGFRNTINENPLAGNTLTMAPGESPEEYKKRLAKAKQKNPLDYMGTLVDKDGSSAKDLSDNPPDHLKNMGTTVDKDGSSADMVQRKAKAFDQVEGALKQLLKKIQDAGL